MITPLLNVAYFIIYLVEINSLKYYCNEGLVPNVKRGRNNYHVFDDRDIEWIHNLACLKKSGMKVSEI